MLGVRATFLQGQYQLGKLNNDTLKPFVVKKQLTEAEYEEITGIPYVPAT